MSSVPWASFTGFNIGSGWDHLAPIFTLGRYTERDGRVLLPLAVQVHHAAADGFHSTRLINELQGFVQVRPGWRRAEGLSRRLRLPEKGRGPVPRRRRELLDRGSLAPALISASGGGLATSLTRAERLPAGAWPDLRVIVYPPDADGGRQVRLDGKTLGKAFGPGTSWSSCAVRSWTLTA
ncbi:CatA-like O-acetyltransferase [Streptomyces sp. NRRL F-2664]|uniref:CatA-like O-acetyltransferase n=1 Tax=Streptomyces sp. NRRL F-2664 TaxID=1463842 RepID=UPI003B63A103